MTFEKTGNIWKVLFAPTKLPFKPTDFNAGIGWIMPKIFLS